MRHPLACGITEHLMDAPTLRPWRPTSTFIALAPTSATGPLRYSTPPGAGGWDPDHPTTAPTRRGDPPLRLADPQEAYRLAESYSPGQTTGCFFRPSSDYYFSPKSPFFPSSGTRDPESQDPPVADLPAAGMLQACSWGGHDSSRSTQHWRQVRARHATRAAIDLSSQTECGAVTFPPGGLAAFDVPRQATERSST